MFIMLVSSAHAAVHTVQLVFFQLSRNPGMHDFWSLAADWGVVLRLRDQFPGQTAGGDKLLGFGWNTELLIHAQHFVNHSHAWQVSSPEARRAVLFRDKINKVDAWMSYREVHEDHHLLC